LIYADGGGASRDPGDHLKSWTAWPARRRPRFAHFGVEFQHERGRNSSNGSRLLRASLLVQPMWSPEYKNFPITQSRGCNRSATAMNGTSTSASSSRTKTPMPRSAAPRTLKRPLTPILTATPSTRSAKLLRLSRGLSSHHRRQRPRGNLMWAYERPGGDAASASPAPHARLLGNPSQLKVVLNACLDRPGGGAGQWR